MASDIKKINEKTVDIFSDFSGLIKHTARSLLWLPEAQLLKTERNRPLKYFTLPGRWAWDVFFFEKNGIIKKDGRGFPDIRFCDNNLKSYSDAKRLLGNTIGKRENFEKLVLKNAQEFWDGFPYDIYNLDFCGTCFPDDQPPFSETFQAVERIIQEHVSKNHFPFIIFLTMKAMESQTNAEAKRQLKENIETNKRDANFTQQINNLIPNTDTFATNNFVDFIIISIPKIICHLAENQCDLEIKARAKYARHNDRDGDFYIAKFILKFTRRHHQRTLGVRNENYINNVLDIMRLDNVRLIDNSCITDSIRRSLNELKSYKNSLDTVQTGGDDESPTG